MIITIPPPASEPTTHCYRVGGEFKIPARQVKLDDGHVLEVPERSLTAESFFLCGRLGDPCVQCGDVSEVLCDFPIGEENRWCDRPLCTRCAPTIEIDKNFCREHLAAGPNMLLFRRPEVLPDPVEMLRQRTVRRPRLPKRPPADRRWRVLQFNRALQPTDLGVALTGWITEIEARAHAHQVRGIVETWDQFVVAFRARWPLKRKPRKR